jgi:DNA-binding transcriptional LysR family regulator
MQGVDETFHVGRTPYADPFLVSTLLSVQLPLFPRLKVDLVSKFSIKLIDDLLAGVLDLAIANDPPESPLLTCVQVLDLKAEAVVPPSGLFENGEDSFHYATCASSASGISACSCVGGCNAARMTAEVCCTTSKLSVKSEALPW